MKEKTKRIPRQKRVIKDSTHFEDYVFFNNPLDEREAKESLGIVYETKQRTANNLFSSFSYYQED